MKSEKDSRARVLIVDDVEGHRETLASFLSAKGYEAFTAADGAAAIGALKEQPVDAAVLDIKLPDISGERLAARLRELDPDLELILVTGYASLETAVGALEARVGAYLTKPLDMDRLLSELGRAVEHRRLVLDKRRAEEALGESEARSRLIIQTMPSGLFTVDLNRTITSWNNKAEDITGLKAKDVVGRYCIEALDCNECKIECGLFSDKVAKPIYGKECVMHVDGRELTILRNADILRDQQGNAIGGLESFVDITDRKNLEEQLRHAQKMEAIGTLAGGVAHDFNNILAGLLGYVSLIKKALGPANPSFADLLSVEKLSWRGADLAKALLAFARKGKYQPRVLNVNGIVENALRVVRETAGSRIQIIEELSGDLPNVVADEGQIHQVIMNLMINACEAMPRRGSLTVRTEVAEPDEQFFTTHPGMKKGPHVAVSVTDTGAGMDAGTRERIFEPFFTTKDEKTGTGLGLSMVIGIIENHGGCIEVESEPGKGSTFTVYLPLTEKKRGAVRPEPAGAMAGDETVLLVDDEEDFRVSTGRQLEGMGYEVAGAASGREALAALEERGGEIDLVVLDMIMKGMDGAETFKKMRKIAPGLPVIICTGYQIDEGCRQLLGEGTCDFIRKPFAADALARKIREVLNSRGGV